METKAQRRLRKSCDFCLKQKVKCDGYDPCGACERRQRRCVFSEKPSAASVCSKQEGDEDKEEDKQEEEEGPPRKRPVEHKRRPAAGGKKRVRAVRSAAKAKDAPAVAVEEQLVQLPLEIQAVGQAIGKEELQFLRLYNATANPVRPFLTKQMAKLGINFHRSATERNLPPGHSVYPCVAGVWAAIAYGACLVRDSRTSIYADCARSALQYCFDHATAETIRAYLLVEAWNSMAAPSRDAHVGFTMFKFAETLWDELRTHRQDPVLDAFMNSCRIHYALANGFLGNFLHRDELLVTKIKSPEDSITENAPLGLRALCETDCWLYNTMLWFMSSNHQPPPVDILRAQNIKFQHIRLQLMEENGWETNPGMMLMVAGILSCIATLMHQVETGVELALEMAEHVQERPVIISRSHLWHVMHVATAFLAHSGHERIAKRLQAILEPNSSIFLGNSDVTRLNGAHPLAKIFIHALLAKRVEAQQQAPLDALLDGLETNYSPCLQRSRACSQALPPRQCPSYPGYEESNIRSARSNLVREHDKSLLIFAELDWQDDSSIETAIQFLDDFHAMPPPGPTQHFPRSL